MIRSAAAVLIIPYTIYVCTTSSMETCTVPYNEMSEGSDHMYILYCMFYIYVQQSSWQVFVKATFLRGWTVKTSLFIVQDVDTNDDWHLFQWFSNPVLKHLFPPHSWLFGSCVFSQSETRRFYSRWRWSGDSKAKLVGSSFWLTENIGSCSGRNNRARNQRTQSKTYTA